MTHEVEVKFPIASPQVFDRIRAQKQVAGPPCGLSERSYRLTEQRIALQQDTYLDTANGSLFRQGVGLRLREKAGAYVVTFKRQVQGIQVRTELETSVTTSQAQELLNGNLAAVPIEAVQAALAYLQTEVVHPVLQVENIRESWYIHTETGRIKICFDTVWYTEPNQTQGFQEYELELELEEGEVGLLQHFVQAFSQQYHLNPSPQSKYERGVELFHIFPSASANKERFTV